MKYPSKVTLVEVGPRDGFQFEKTFIPTRMKLEIIEGLCRAGLKHIQAASFVRPEKVPQMGDAKEIFESLPRKNDVRFSALALNKKGVERAGEAGVEYIDVSVSASETHGKKNAGMGLEEALDHMKEMIRIGKRFQMTVTASIQCAFGCVYEGSVPSERIVEFARAFVEEGADQLSLADTTGMASPLSIQQLLEKVLVISNRMRPPVSLHLHDTRGLGLANVLAAMDMGIDIFDTAMGGMGGCPFVPGAAGNISTEDTVYMMKEMGIETGVDMAQVAQCSQKLEQFFQKSFSGKNHRLVTPVFQT